MGETVHPTLEYARPAGPAPMPTGALVLLSLALPGLGSLLLCGRGGLRFALLLNGAAVASVYAVGGLLAMVPPSTAARVDDWAGWLLVAGYVVILAFGLRRALRDRNRLTSEGLPQASAVGLWKSLFWVAAVAAACGLGAAFFAVGFGLILGGPHPLFLVLLAATCAASLLLIALVVNTITSQARQTR